MTDDEGVRHLFTAAEAERVLGIRASTIRTWANRKRIWAFGLDERRQPMYDKRDLIALRDRTRTRDQHEQRRRKVANSDRSR